MLKVSGWTSQKMGIAACKRMGMTLPMSVIGPTIISSPGEVFNIPTPMCRLAVPEVLAIAYFAPCISANSFSNCSTFVPPKRNICPE